MVPDLDDYRWLVSSAAEPWLARVAADTRELAPLVASLRKDLSPARAHLILELTELRARARGSGKFPQGSRLFFTRKGYEQATSEAVAGYKAERFSAVAEDADFAEGLADLGCGIGGDLIAMAVVHGVVGVERDPVAALFAAANLETLGLTQGRALCREMAEGDVTAAAAWHLDPDRRRGERRTSRPALGAPGPAVIRQLLAANGAAAVKLAPAADAAELFASGPLPCTESPLPLLEWISENGECKQQVAWFGCLTEGQDGRRRATAIQRTPDGSGSVCSVTASGDAAAPPIAVAVGSFLFEADAAVRAAGLTPALAAKMGLQMTDAAGAYLTSDHPAPHGLLTVFAVEEVLPLDFKKVRQALRQRKTGTVEVKQRGVGIDANPWQRQLSTRRAGESEKATIIALHINRRRLAVLARRLDE